MIKNIRNSTKNDICRISEIEVFNYRLNFYPIFKNDWFYFNELQVCSIMDRYLSNQDILKNVFVYDDGIVKGFIFIDGMEIKKLFVEPIFQGKSIGMELLNFAICDKNVSFLWALEKNYRAIKFYEKYGFHTTNEKKLEEGTTEYLIKLER